MSTSGGRSASPAERSNSGPAEGSHEASRAISDERSVIDFVLRNRILQILGAVLIVWALPPWYGSNTIVERSPSHAAGRLRSVPTQSGFRRC